MKNNRYILIISLLFISFVVKAQNTIVTNGFTVRTDNPYWLTINPAWTYFGETCIKGEGKEFGAQVFNFGDDVFSGQLMMSLWQNGEMKEAYTDCLNFDLNANGERVAWLLPCWVTVPEGTYELVPLLKKKGDDFWNKPAYQDCEKKHWMYTVQKELIAPSCSFLLPHGCIQGFDWIQDVTKSGTNLNVDFTVSNKTSQVLTGDLVFCYERDIDKFWKRTSISSSANLAKWRDEIGKKAIVLQPNETISNQVICQGTFHDYIDSSGIFFCSPSVNVYFRPENSTELIPVRDNCDSMFEDKRVKTIIKSEPSFGTANIQGITNNFFYYDFTNGQTTSTGLNNEKENNNSVFLYDNQSKQVRIKIDGFAQVTLISANGAVIKRLNIVNEGNIDLTNQPDGLYLFNLTGDKINKTIKFLK